MHQEIVMRNIMRALRILMKYVMRAQKKYNEIHNENAWDS